MGTEISITPWHWLGFVSAILIFLCFDLEVFHRKARIVRFREAAIWASFWFLVAMTFGTFLASSIVQNWDKEEIVQFITGYIIELSLSMDNVFVIALIFVYFKIPEQQQHRVLFWGILGALLMRGMMIWMGTNLITRFHWMLYVLGAFLLFTGAKTALTETQEVDPDENPFIRIARKLFPISPDLDGQKFVTTFNKGPALTPLAMVLVMVETTDLIFALDSIPAIFAVTRDPFIVFTSNVFAILGLRSLYFVLAGAIGYFRYLKVGLSVVLCFIGLKMLVVRWYAVPTISALAVVAGVILISILYSIKAANAEKITPKRAE